jgi:hypothetical protein
VLLLSAIARRVHDRCFQEDINMAGFRNVISTLNSNGEEIMGREVLLYHHPDNDPPATRAGSSRVTQRSVPLTILRPFG